MNENNWTDQPSRAEIDEFLQAIELFQELTAVERDAVEAKLRVIEFEKDQVSVRGINQSRENLFLIYRGTVGSCEKSAPRRGESSSPGSAGSISSGKGP